MASGRHGIVGVGAPVLAKGEILEASPVTSVAPVTTFGGLGSVSERSEREERGIVGFVVVI